MGEILGGRSGGTGTSCDSCHETSAASMPPPTMTATERLRIRPFPWDAVEAIEAGRRLGGWADDYPDAGDVVIAGMLSGAGPSRPDPGKDVWGHHQVIERSSDLVVGGIGFFGRPEDGVVEMGYGIVPSRQGKGYATEAVMGLLSAAWSYPDLQTVVADTEGANIASQRVLEKAGFALEAQEGLWHYRLSRPPQAHPVQ